MYSMQPLGASVNCISHMMILHWTDPLRGNLVSGLLYAYLSYLNLLASTAQIGGHFSCREITAPGIDV